MMETSQDITELKRIEEELPLQNEIMSNIAEGIYLLRLDDATIVYVNPKFEKMSGYDPGELIGRHVSIVNTPTDESSEEKAEGILAVLHEGGEWHGEINNIKKDGTTFWCHANVSIFDHSKFGQVLIAAHTDITQRKRAEEAFKESETKYRHFFSTITNGWAYHKIVTDSENNPVDYVFLEVNEAYERLTGLARDEILGKRVTEVLPGIEKEPADWIGRFGEVALSGTASSFEKYSETMAKWYAVSASCPEPEYFIVIFDDITARKLAEDALKNANRELEAFTYTVSHDLRNPLIPIIGYAEILRENYKEQLDEQGLSYLSEIENAGAEMLVLMESLLSLAQSGTLERPIDRVSTDEIVAGVIKKQDTNISRAGVVFQVNPLPSVHVPKTFLIQIFDNLIGNATRYAGNIGSIIEVGGEQKGGKVSFYVRDHGPGIPEEERKHIFEIFYRGTNKGEVKGSGLGLAIVYKIARNCGGRAWVDETHGGGCTFWVEIEDVAQA